jgi:hypothetical protein
VPPGGFHLPQIFHDEYVHYKLLTDLADNCPSHTHDTPDTPDTPPTNIPTGQNFPGGNPHTHTHAV